MSVSCRLRDSVAKGQTLEEPPAYLLESILRGADFHWRAIDDFGTQEIDLIFFRQPCLMNLVSSALSLFVVRRHRRGDANGCSSSITEGGASTCRPVTPRGTRTWRIGSPLITFCPTAFFATLLTPRTLSHTSPAFPTWPRFTPIHRWLPSPRFSYLSLLFGRFWELWHTSGTRGPVEEALLRPL